MAETRKKVDMDASRPTEHRGVEGQAATAARLALAGVVVYVAIDVALVLLRPQFSVLHSAESDYGSPGAWAWLMDLNFLLRCALSLAAVRVITIAGGTCRLMRVTAALLVIWALASGLLAFLPDAPAGTTPTHAGAIHLAVALVSFLAVTVAILVGTRALAAQPRWRHLALPMAACAAAALVALIALFIVGLGAQSPGGLAEKAFLGLVLLWLALACAPAAVGARGAAAVRLP